MSVNPKFRLSYQNLLYFVFDTRCRKHARKISSSAKRTFQVERKFGAHAQVLSSTLVHESDKDETGERNCKEMKLRRKNMERNKVCTKKKT